MRTPRSSATRFGSRARRVVAAMATVAAAVSCTNDAFAQLTLAYSFETGLEGFGPNGGGASVDLDTIGATDGTSSMRFDVEQLATFVGALTGSLTPEIGDPPGMGVVRFDLTLTTAFPTEGFANAGITIFGASQPDHPNGQQFGLQAQFLGNEFALGDLPVGTHEIEMELTSAQHPLTFATNQSFNDIFGEVGSGVNDLIPTGFQIYINKSTHAPWTGYIDNIRVGNLPAGPNADFNDDTFVNSLDLEIWKGAFGQNALGDADGDLDSDGEDFLLWQRQLNIPGGGVAAVPEPTAAAFAGTALLALAWWSRSSAFHPSRKQS
jgi:hypothetical protein